MITLKKNEYIEINKNCHLCYCQIWGSDEYLYMVAINNYPGYRDLCRAIYGWGKTCEEAMVMALGNLVDVGLKSFPLENQKETTLNDFLECFISKDGYIDDPKKILLADLSKVPNEEIQYYAKDQGFDICIQDGECYPIIS